ncbi:ribonuclease D [Glaciecola sp. 1036]|uniref:ribonuclease D n=1 Tax=Alteromonadaceae TaxID=72275 RepID=UPI003CFC46EE
MDAFATLNTQYQYIETQEALDALCERLAEHEFISLDTEFVRTKTLYPLLGLIQIFDGKQVYLIDNTVMQSLASLKALAINPNVVKVIHSCSEDLDAISYNVGSFPTPIFDTQIAAHFLNLGNSLGYANLVEKLCNVSLDKTESRTDWLARPLRKEQLEYASADVTYLYKVYEILKAEVQQKGFLNMVIDEAQLMVDKKLNAVPEDNAYLNYSNAWKLAPKNLYALQLLAGWRLQLAREQNITLNFILRENVILEIAQKLPKSPNQLSRMYGITRKQIRLYSDTVLGIVRQVEMADESAYPDRIERLINFPLYKNASSEIKRQIMEVAEKTGLPESAIASKKQINDVLKYTWFEKSDLEDRQLKPDLLMGWRRELLGARISELFSESGKYHARRSL